MMQIQSFPVRVLRRMRSLLVVTTLLSCSHAQAFYQAWVVNEVYSNADGSIQFVELRATASQQHSLSEGATLIARNANGMATNIYVFTSDLPSSATFQRTMLLATQGFVGQPGAVTPDFIIPPNFVFLPAGSLNYSGNDIMTYTNLPSDGVASLVRSGANQLVYNATNSPRNFAGQTGSIQPSGLRLLAPQLAGNQFIFSFNTTTGKTYTVEATPTLAPTNWLTVLTVPGNGLANSVTNDTTAPQHYYRLRAE